MKRLALLFLLLFACSPPTPAVVFDDVSFHVDVARTAEEKSQGLMFRESMPDDEGMLFVFDDAQRRAFWMKNTLIPLDMIFLDGDLRVVEVKRNVPPCERDPCPAYQSVPAVYVLEVNAGLAEKYNIKPGSQMRLRE